MLTAHIHSFVFWRGRDVCVAEAGSIPASLSEIEECALAEAFLYTSRDVGGVCLAHVWSSRVRESAIQPANRLRFCASDGHQRVVAIYRAVSASQDRQSVVDGSRRTVDVAEAVVSASGCAGERVDDSGRCGSSSSSSSAVVVE